MQQDSFKEEIKKVEKAIANTEDGLFKEKLYIIYDYVQAMDKGVPNIEEFRRRASELGYKFLHFDEWWKTKENGD